MVDEGIVKSDRTHVGGGVEACRMRVDVHYRVCEFFNYRKLGSTWVRLASTRWGKARVLYLALFRGLNG